MQKQDKRIQIMQDAPPLKAIFTMSIPVILGMMVNVIYNLVDTWFIGMMGDELQLAASNYCTPIFVIILAVASLIGTGGASFLSLIVYSKLPVWIERHDILSANH